MTTTIFSKLGYKIFTLLISVFFVFNTYVPPMSNDPIQTNTDTKAKLTAVLWGDSQVSNYMLKRVPYFDAACEDLEKNVSGTADALIIAGDIAENGLLCEYEYVSSKLKNAKVDNFLFAVGNHDVRLRLYKSTVRKFSKLSNELNGKQEFSSLTYRYDINGYAFIVLGTDRTEFEESYFTDETLNWVDENLKTATASGKPVFVICHQPLKLTHGLPDTWNSPFDFAGSIGEQSDRLNEIMNKYENVFFITGHLHTGFGQYTYEKSGRVHSVNLPSLTINNKDGVCNDNGIGFVMEVYENRVAFRARNFAKGEYIPQNDIEIEL